MSRGGGLSVALRKRAALDKVNEDRNVEIDEFRRIEAQARGIQNDIDRAWIKSLLEWPDLFEASKGSLQSALEYLEANPNKELHPRIRERFEALAAVIEMRKRGVPPKAFQREKKVGKRRYDPALAAAVKRPLPDWMSDPSLLPKKPPGRAA